MAEKEQENVSNKQQLFSEVHDAFIKYHASNPVSAADFIKLVKKFSESEGLQSDFNFETNFVSEITNGCMKRINQKSLYAVKRFLASIESTGSEKTDNFLEGVLAESYNDEMMPQHGTYLLYRWAYRKKDEMSISKITIYSTHCDNDKSNWFYKEEKQATKNVHISIKGKITRNFGAYMFIGEIVEKSEDNEKYVGIDIKSVDITPNLIGEKNVMYGLALCVERTNARPFATRITFSPTSDDISLTVTGVRKPRLNEIHLIENDLELINDETAKYLLARKDINQKKRKLP